RTRRCQSRGLAYPVRLPLSPEPMHVTSESVEALVEQFSKLPTIGRKTAQRLAAYVLKMPREEVVEIARALVAVKDRVKQCSVCFNVTDSDPCPICRSERRTRSVVCVVE